MAEEIEEELGPAVEELCALPWETQEEVDPELVEAVFESTLEHVVEEVAEAGGTEEFIEQGGQTEETTDSDTQAAENLINTVSSS